VRKLLLFLSLLLFASSALAQSTTVSGQVTDAGGQSWNNGTITAVFVTNPNYPSFPQYMWTGGVLSSQVSGTLNGTGGYSFSVPSNSAITPVNSQWRFQICPEASSPCFYTSPVTITGATQTVNATPPAILINLLATSPPVFAYADTEVTGVSLGSQYYNVTNSQGRVCQAVSASACTSWANSGGGGGGPTLQTNGVNNVSQSTLNFVTSTTNASGLAVTPSNSTSQEKIEVSGTLAHASLPALVSGDIPNNAANTTGTAANLTGCSPSTAGSVCYWNGSAWTLLAGNSSGTNWLQETSAGVPSWTTPAGGSSAWSSLTAPTGAGNFPLAMGSNTSIFTTTTALSQMFAWKNVTAATSGTSQASPINSICGRAWNGADIEDCLTLQDIPGNGSNAAITFAVGHTGSSTGLVTTTFPGPVQAGASGTNAGMVSLPGNTSNPALPANSFSIIGPASASFTAYALQFSTTPASGNQVIQCGTPSGGISACSFVAGGGAPAWSSITNATANLSLNNTGFNTTFSQSTTGGTDTWTWQNTTAALVGTCQPTPTMVLAGTYWNGAASAADSWTLQGQCTSGSNGNETLNFAHAGSTGHLAFGFQGGASIRFDGGLMNMIAASGSAVTMTSGSDIVFNGTNNSNAITAQFGDISSGTSITIPLVSTTPGQKAVISTQLKATAALTSGQVVKVDSANANSVVVAATTDTGAGAVLGFVENSPGAAAAAQIAIPGSIIVDPLLGTGTCSIGNFVIVDTTTAGRVKCTGTFAAGTILGYAVTAQASVGSAVSVYVLAR
jgi:hypothetical protein